MTYAGLFVGSNINIPTFDPTIDCNNPTFFSVKALNIWKQKIRIFSLLWCSLYCLLMNVQYIIWVLKLNQLTAVQTDGLRVLSNLVLNFAQWFHRHRLEGRIKIINRTQLARGPVNNELCSGLFSFLEPLRYIARLNQKVIVFQRWKRQYMETRLNGGSPENTVCLA